MKAYVCMRSTRSILIELYIFSHYQHSISLCIVLLMYYISMHELRLCLMLHLPSEC